MLVTKVLFAFGMMTLAVIILPIQIAKLIYRRAKLYSPIISQSMLLITPYSENECPGIVLSMPEDLEPRESGVKVIKAEPKVMH